MKLDMDVQSTVPLNDVLTNKRIGRGKSDVILGKASSIKLLNAITLGTELADIDIENICSWFSDFKF